MWASAPVVQHVPSRRPARPVRRGGLGRRLGSHPDPRPRTDADRLGPTAGYRSDAGPRSPGWRDRRSRAAPRWKRGTRFRSRRCQRRSRDCPIRPQAGSHRGTTSASARSTPVRWVAAPPLDRYHGDVTADAGAVGDAAPVRRPGESTEPGERARGGLRGLSLEPHHQPWLPRAPAPPRYRPRPDTRFATRLVTTEASGTPERSQRSARWCARPRPGGRRSAFASADPQRTRPDCRR